MIWADGKPLASSDKPDRKKRARHWLTKGSMAREDSDDELGYEDHPWEWIYVAENKGNRNENLSLDRANSKSTRDSGRLRVPKKIVGARMGNFECRLGQVVLLKSPEAGKDWAGIICEFLEVEDEDQDDMVKSANIMWLASPDEFISTKNKKRVDALPNEQYLTTDFNVNPLSSINGRAHVMSKDAFFRKYPNGNPPRGRVALAEYKKCIICRRSVNQLKGKYTEEFIWEDVYQEDEQTVFDLIDMATSRLKSSKKRKPMDKDVGIIIQGCNRGVES
jgi:origin recognition complex subunit 1